MKPELPTKSGDEVDAFSSWRKVLSCFKRPGLVKKAQRAYNKRVRQYTKVEIAEVFDEQIEYAHLDDMPRIIQEIREAKNG